jgi:phosphoglycolate phosphatase
MRDLTLVFDLDGTLVDTAPDLIAGINRTIASAGLAAVPAEIIRTEISFGSRHMLRKALAHHGARRGDAELDRLLERFLADYAENIAVESRPFPGVVALLEDYRSAGVRLAVCTNKRELHSVVLLQQLGIERLFAGIAGRDTFPVSKPHPDHLLGAIRLAGGDPRRAVMVGDSATDVETARSAGVPVIAVSFGYSDVPVRSLAADAVIDHFAEFPEALQRVIGR